MKRTPEEELKFRVKNPFCTFCEYSYYSFFHVCCAKLGLKNGCSAKGCNHYSPTLITIEERSPKT